MRIGMRAGRTRIAVATAAAVLASGGVAAATEALSDEVIHTCVHQGNGQLRIVSKASDCKNGEGALSWNQRGPAGERGAAGADGEAGPAGQAGAQGEKGDAGAQGEKGDAGAQGEKGEAGAQGEKGEAGAKGEAGTQGEKGEAGAQGERGEVGPAGKGMDVRTVTVGPNGTAVEVPVLGGAKLVLSPWGGGFTCEISYRNAGADRHTLMQPGSAPVSVDPGTTRHLGQGYSKQTSPEDRSVVDASGEHGAWFRVAATQRLAGDDGLACVYQVVVAAA